MTPTPAPSKVRYHAVAATATDPGSTRVTGLRPADQKRLHQFITEQLGGKAYVS